MDYEKLLVKYIQYIREMEGTDYLGYNHIPPPFIKAEWDELGKLACIETTGRTDGTETNN